MEGIEDNNENKSNTIKKFILEVSGRFKVNSTVEYSNYQEALESFNQHSKSGKNLILYEVHKSTLDGSIVKKVPVLNTSKQAQRLRMLEEEKARAKALSQKGSGVHASSADYHSSPSPSPSSSPSSYSPGFPDGSTKKNKVTLASMKYKIIILASVVAGLIVTLLLQNLIADMNSGGGGFGGHHVILYEAVNNYLQISFGEFANSDPTIISSHLSGLYYINSEFIAHS
ncbi:MAG TPA: hypothetical protein VD815_04485 [Candidatus Saccharimonadales bacterium]|nr:hypothetical protein [Candidatus Saccharimonadales bacterium]